MNPAHFYVPKCLQSDHLVYVANLKCASTFFYENFKQAGWQHIDFHRVDLEQHQVFGHVLEPRLRRAKAQAEFLYMNSLCRDFLQDLRLQKLILNALMLDYHSISYLTCFGTHVWQIDWIPLAYEHTQVIGLTERFLVHHEQSLPTWDYSWAHKTQDIKNACSDRLLYLMTDADERRRISQELLWQNIYQDVKDVSWPACPNPSKLASLSYDAQQELLMIPEIHKHFVVQDGSISLRMDRDDDGSMEIFHRISSKYLDPDLEFYRELIANFDPTQTNWRDVSWLARRSS